MKLNGVHLWNLILRSQQPQPNYRIMAGVIIDQFAAAYLNINDKTYIANILQKTLAKGKPRATLPR